MTIYLKKFSRFLYRRWSRLLDIIGDIKLFKFPLFLAYDPSKLGMCGEKIQEAMDIL